MAGRPGKAPRRPASDEDARRLLCEGEFRGLELVPWASNYTFAATLALPDGAVYVGIYKPCRGEIPLYDFPDGTLYRREVAAYRAARALGWDVIPLTVVRTGPHGIGSLQLFVEADPRYDVLRDDGSNQAAIQRLTLFDFLANNADRKAGHVLRGHDGRLWGIDHGLTFNTEPKLRTVLWQQQGEPIPQDLLAELQEFADDSERGVALRGELGGLLQRAEVDGFFERLDRVLALRRFPSPGLRRHVPWPLY
jgi:uncharacterized repeat protein (TIGR03843 family)